MYVTVSVKMDLDATASLSELEQQIQEAGRAAMQAALKDAIRQREETQQTCPACGSGQVRTHETKRQVLLTSFGRVEVPLKRVRCQQCGQRFRPADGWLAEVRGHTITPQLRELASLLGGSWPYATAARLLKQLSGVQLSAERLRQLTNEQGTRVAQEQQTHAQQVLADAVNPLLIRRARVQAERAIPPERPSWLQVGLDGGWVPSREQQGGMEGKIGVVASHREPVGKRGRHRLSQRRYVATFGPAEEVGLLSYAAACESGAAEARQQVVVGDGADWIKTQAEDHFPDAVKTLDWPHLWRKIRAAVRALQPGKHPARRAWRKQQYEGLLPLLWAGEREEALQYLRHLRSASGDAPAAVEEAIRYLETQQDWLGNYARWQEQGYPVGSGLVERAVALVINVRMKQRGMRWKCANATAVVALRVQQINTNWDAVA
jgi:hypothetical protein